MNKKDLKHTIETLLSAPNTRHETLSLLCELAPLRHKRLQETLTGLHTKPKVKGPIALTPSTLKLLQDLTPPPFTQPTALLTPLTHTLALSETLSYLEQLERLLTDIELLTTLTPTLSPP